MRVPQILLVTLLAAGGGHAQSTCATGRVSLLPLSSTSFTVGTSVYTFGFCNAVHTSLSSLTACSALGYVQAHNTANSGCLASYSSIVTGLTQTTTGAYFIVQDAGATQKANVSITCDQGATSGTVNLRTPIATVTTSGVTTTTFDLTSLAGCSIDDFFCSATVSCSDSTKSCIQGVCFDKTCATVATVLQETKSPANFVSEVSVQDCHGTPLTNLTNSDFTVTLDGQDLAHTSLANEVIHVIEPAPEEPVPTFTTLLLDQSASVLTNGQSVLQQAANTFVNIVTESSTNHFVAIIAFDGGKNTATVQDYTNDLTVLLERIANGLPPPALVDSGSTDLYSAVINGLDEAYRMTFSFGNTSVPVTSSMIVFTDGHDTARRTTSAVAIAKAAAMASKVKIMAVGIANTSDTAFLTSISTSGFFEFVSLSNLVQSFSDAANKLVALTSNNYYVLMCIPMRKTGIPITISLASATFPSTNTLSFSVDGTSFIGGCTEVGLRAEIKSASSVASAAVDQLVQGSSLTKVVPVDGAFFFYFQLTSSVTVSVIPTSLTVLYVKAKRCILSDSCNDGNFTGGFAPPSLNTRYDAMVQNSGGLAAQVIVTTVDNTPAPVPLATNALGQAVPGLNPINWSAPNIDEGAPDLDRKGAIVLVAFVAIFLAAFMVGALYVRSEQSKSIEASAKKRRKFEDRSISYSPRGQERQGQLLEAPVYSEIQPYRLDQQTRSLNNSQYHQAMSRGGNAENSLGLLNHTSSNVHNASRNSGNSRFGNQNESRRGSHFMDASPAQSQSNSNRYSPASAPPTRADIQGVYLPPQVPQGSNAQLGDGQGFDAQGRPKDDLY